MDDASRRPRTLRQPNPTSVDKTSRSSPSPPCAGNAPDMSPVNSRRFVITNVVANRVVIPVLRSRAGRRLGRRLAVVEYMGRRSGRLQRLVTQDVTDGQTCASGRNVRAEDLVAQLRSEGPYTSTACGRGPRRDGARRAGRRPDVRRRGTQAKRGRGESTSFSTASRSPVMTLHPRGVDAPDHRRRRSRQAQARPRGSPGASATVLLAQGPVRRLLLAMPQLSEGDLRDEERDRPLSRPGHRPRAGWLAANRT